MGVETPSNEGWERGFGCKEEPTQLQPGDRGGWCPEGRETVPEATRKFQVVSLLPWVRACLLLNPTTHNLEERCSVLMIEPGPLAGGLEPTTGNGAGKDVIGSSQADS